MSDDEADPELLALLRQHLQSKLTVDDAPETGVLSSAEYVYDNSIDVALDMRATKAAAAAIHAGMEAKNAACAGDWYEAAAWSDELHELHPRTRDEAALQFVFTMDLLNFSFWSDRPAGERFAVEYKGKTWTGYWSMVAALQRAVDAGIPITSSDFWQSEDECTLEVLKDVFRSSTAEEMPMLEERLAVLREAGQVLYEYYDCSLPRLVSSAKQSAAGLVNTLALHFPSFRDECRSPWPGRSSRKPLRFLKRAQIFAADLWACFGGEGFGEFRDIGRLTAFADYRVPQALATMGCLYYSPSLDTAMRHGRVLEGGGSWEVQLRGCSIWCVEQIRKEILREHPDSKVSSVLIDFFLYDTMKELEAKGQDPVPFHRTRSIWY